MSIPLSSGMYNDKGLYFTPANPPLKIYAWNELYSDYPVSNESSAGQYINGIAVIYRTYVYYSDDYAQVRTGITQQSADTPNYLSGTYVAAYSGDNSGGSLDIDKDIYTIEYVIQRTQIRIYVPTGQVTETPLDLTSWTYTIAVASNRLPLKKWTIIDVIVRACDLIEHLRYGEKPRFRLDGVAYDNTTGNATGNYTGIAAELDKILSPEYAFTKMHFREQMQQIGGKIHAEFSITGFGTGNGRRYYTFTSDKYGGIKMAALLNDEKKQPLYYFFDSLND